MVSFFKEQGAKLGTTDINIWFYASVPVGPGKPLQRTVGVRVDHYYTSDQVERFRVHGRQRIILVEKIKGQSQPWRMTNIPANESQAVMDTLAIIIRQIEKYLDIWKGTGTTEGFINIDAPRGWGSWPGSKG